jgi:hypothetical protein
VNKIMSIYLSRSTCNCEELMEILHLRYDSVVFLSLRYFMLLC